MRTRAPTRSLAVPAQPRYQAYKPHLRVDFGQRCGYCDDWDILCGGHVYFHVDHFAPKSVFPALRLSYENLVYSCSFCNVAKSNKWVGIDATVANNGAEGFVDPCSVDYVAHLTRDETGRIVARTPLGAYMVRHLRLTLERHRLLWNLRRVFELQERAEALRQGMARDDEGYVPLLEMIASLAAEYRSYMGELNVEAG